jgi:acetyl esterase/lipase
MPAMKNTYTYKFIYGCAIHTDVYRAAEVPGPAILWLHGGMLMAGSRADLPAAQLERYLQAGYTVVSADYRLAPETKLPDIITDVQDVYAWTRAYGHQEFGIDPDHIAVIGHSAGGYLTLLAGHHLLPRPRALVSYYGYSDVDGAWYSQPDPFYSQKPPVSLADAQRVIGTQIISEASGPGVSPNRGTFYLYCRQNGLWPNEVVGHDPHLEPQAFDPFCPIRNVSAEYPPTLLIHGALDTDVPHEQSAQMARELERQGVTHEFVSLPKHGHAFDLGENSTLDPVVVAAFDQTLAFLGQHMRPR